MSNVGDPREGCCCCCHGVGWVRTHEAQLGERVELWVSNTRGLAGEGLGVRVTGSAGLVARVGWSKGLVARVGWSKGTCVRMCWLHHTLVQGTRLVLACPRDSLGRAARRCSTCNRCTAGADLGPEVGLRCLAPVHHAKLAAIQHGVGAGLFARSSLGDTHGPVSLAWPSVHGAETCLH